LKSIHYRTIIPDKIQTEPILKMQARFATNRRMISPVASHIFYDGFDIVFQIETAGG